jgi:flavin-dependent dehydrogenase
VLVCDCLILGAGVAGASLAWRLATAGHTVLAVDAATGRYSGPFETMLADSLASVRDGAFAAVLQASSEPDPLRHGAIWGEDELVWRDAPPGRLLRRGAFDAQLRAAAAAAGADVRCPARATHDGERWWLQEPGRQLVVAPRCVVRATGRVGTAGSGGALGPSAIAFTFVGEPAASDHHTAVVEAVPTGWIWSHVAAVGAATAAVVVDPGELRQVGRERLLAAAFAASRGPAGRLLRRRLGHVSAAGGGWREPVAGELAIGDAAATIDPLASQGVAKALAAAEHAAAVVATALARPEWWPRLCAVHARWERGLAAAHAATAAAWYGRETRFAAAPFWQARRGAPGAPANVDEVRRPQPFVVAPGVAPAVVLVREGHRFVEQPGFQRSDGETIHHVGYVPVAPLFAMLQTPHTLAAATAQAGASPQLFVLPPPAVHAALVTLAQRGWLSPAASAGGNP